MTKDQEIEMLNLNLAEALWHLDGVLNSLPENMSCRFGDSRSFLGRHAQAEQRDEWHAKSISEGMVEAVAGAVTPVSELRGEWAQRARDAQVEQQEAQGAQAGDEAKSFERWWTSTEILRKNKMMLAQEAWLARAALATQPAAGEHVCTLKGRIPHYAIKGSNFLPCYCWSGVDHQIGREVNAPPAAAPVAAVEPVAWMYDTPSNGRQYHGK